MNLINMSANEINYCWEVNARLTEKIVNAFKKYYKENSEIIFSGLASLNGNVTYNRF